MDESNVAQNPLGSKEGPVETSLFDLDGPTIIRTYKNRANPYAQIHRGVLEDRRLSWGARGVMAYLLAKPDNWTVQPKDLEANGGCGRDAIRSILGELERYGYLWRHRVRQKGGTFGWVHRVYESPELNPNFKPEVVEGAKKPATGKPSMVEPATAEPSPGKPSPVQPSPVEASSYQGSDRPKTDLLNKQKQKTHTQTEAPAAPPPGVVGALSKFSPDECRRYADHLHKTGQGINNPGGFAVKIHSTGQCDEQIARFLGLEQQGAEPESVDVSAMLSDGQGGRHRFYSLLNRLYDACDPGGEMAGKIALLRGDVFSLPRAELLSRYGEIKQMISRPLARAVNE